MSNNNNTELYELLQSHGRYHSLGIIYGEVLLVVVELFFSSSFKFRNKVFQAAIHSLDHSSAYKHIQIIHSHYSFFQSQSNLIRIVFTQSRHLSSALFTTLAIRSHHPPSCFCFLRNHDQFFTCHTRFF